MKKPPKDELERELKKIKAAKDKKPKKTKLDKERRMCYKMAMPEEMCYKRAPIDSAVTDEPSDRESLEAELLAALKAKEQAERDADDEDIDDDEIKIMCYDMAEAEAEEAMIRIEAELQLKAAQEEAKAEAEAALKKAQEEEEIRAAMEEMRRGQIMCYSMAFPDPDNDAEDDEDGGWMCYMREPSDDELNKDPPIVSNDEEALEIEIKQKQVQIAEIEYRIDLLKERLKEIKG